MKTNWIHEREIEIERGRMGSELTLVYGNAEADVVDHFADVSDLKSERV